MPFYSIIIVTYNREKFIGKAIESVLSQTFSDWELIIVDDGSSDNTKDIVLDFNDDRIKYFFQENQERSVARNNGIKKCIGDYLCFLDSDDYYLENHLEVLNKAINSSGNCIYFTNRYYETNGIKEKYKYNEKISDDSSQNLINYGIKNSPPIQTIAINRNELLESKVIFKDDFLPFSECNQFSIELLYNGFELKSISEYTVVMVNHDFNTTTFTKEFVESKYSFIKSMKNQYTVSSKALTRSIADLEISLANFCAKDNEPRIAFNLLVKSINNNFTLLFTRQFLGVLKSIIL